MIQDKCCKKNRCCVDIIICILTSLITFVVGVIIGALTTLVTTLGIGAVIAILTILVILLIIRILTLICFKDDCKKECYNDYDKYCWLDEYKNNHNGDRFMKPITVNYF